jgi:hypothetical protein
VLDSLALCAAAGYAPLTVPGADSQSALQFVGAWEALNPDRRDALYARLAWCLAADGGGSGGGSPCDVTKLIRVDDSGVAGAGAAPTVAYWAWAGWFDSTAFAATHASALTAPAVLTYNCSGASSQAGYF